MAASPGKITQATQLLRLQDFPCICGLPVEWDVGPERWGTIDASTVHLAVSNFEVIKAMCGSSSYAEMDNLRNGQETLRSLNDWIVFQPKCVMIGRLR